MILNYAMLTILIYILLFITLNFVSTYDFSIQSLSATNRLFSDEIREIKSFLIRLSFTVD